MKTSIYNYFIPRGNRYIFFNGITQRFFYVSAENHDRFKDIISHPENTAYQEKYGEFLDRMKVEGFVVDDNVDEMDLIYKDFEKQRYSDQYMLMILPTYRCNLRCWYCIQEHQDVNLSNDTVERIKKHIGKYLLESGVKRFRLSWFGGEPLLEYDKIVDITRFSKNFCEQNNIEFYSDITTNSLLLNHDRIVLLNDLGVKIYQITIDGCRERHNKVKISKGNSAFDKAVNNILDIVKTNPDVSCTLRINYSDETLEPGKIMHDVNMLIPYEYRKYVRIIPRRIWQIETFPSELERICELSRIAKNKHYVIRGVDRGMCYVDYTHFNCIFPNGRVDKCENESLDDTKGFLDENGNIIWSSTNLFEKYQVLSETSDCINCKHLPFCMGPCPQRRNDMAMRYGRIVCKYPDADSAIEKLIVQYCEENSNVNV